MASPAIACIGIIGKHDNPLHITLFPPHMNEKLDFMFLLNSCLDIFEIRQNNKTIDQDLGLLQAVDERLATYGWLTNTGVKFVIVVDMAGKPAVADDDRKKTPMVTGLRDSDLKPAFRALQTAYIQLLQNPFYSPDDHTPMASAHGHVSGSTQISNARFSKEVKRIGDIWGPGVTNI